MNITRQQAKDAGIFIPASYKRKTLDVKIVESVTPYSWYWSGGSIYYWSKRVRGTSYLLNKFPPFPYTQPADTICLSADTYVIRTGIFNGKDAMMCAYLHPDSPEAKACEQFRTDSGV